MSSNRWMLALLVGLAPALGLGTARAQGYGMAQQNAQFDQQFNAQLRARMMQNQASQQQLLQRYINTYRPQLVAGYQQYVARNGPRMTFEQYAYWSMTTMGGTNYGPALAQQQRNFQAMQQNHQAVQQGFQDYNGGWQKNQDSLSNTYNRYDQQGVRGYQYYRNSETGQVTELPYDAQPGVYQNNEGTWAADPNGQYHQIDPQGYKQRMDPVEKNINPDEIE
ncbi:MAG TPA: hypothetical protein VKV03_16130 [Candidatus Binataceae bacterium]|nr:hypothetical protein [Candidatus Binataceae bacterium]